MGLKITSIEEHNSGNATTTYLHISQYHKPKEGDKINVAIRCYTTKARRDANMDNQSVPKSMDCNIALDMTMAEFATSGDTTSAVYALLKTYLEGLGKTVVDDNA